MHMQHLKIFEMTISLGRNAFEIGFTKHIVEML